MTLRLHQPQFTIGRLMIAVAVAGLVSAWARVSGASLWTIVAPIQFGPMLGALIYVGFLAKPGHRLAAATWVASLWPLSIPWSINASALLVRGLFGPSPDAEARQILELSIAPAFLLAPCSMIVGLILIIPKTGDRKGAWRSRAVPTLLIPVVWVATVLLVWMDPLSALETLMS